MPAFALGDLVILGGSTSTGYHVNQSGVVLSTLPIPGSYTHGFGYSQGGIFDNAGDGALYLANSDSGDVGSIVKFSRSEALSGPWIASDAGTEGAIWDLSLGTPAGVPANALPRGIAVGASTLYVGELGHGDFAALTGPDCYVRLINKATGAVVGVITMDKLADNFQSNCWPAVNADESLLYYVNDLLGDGIIGVYDLVGTTNLANLVTVPGNQFVKIEMTVDGNILVQSSTGPILYEPDGTEIAAVTYASLSLVDRFPLQPNGITADPIDGDLCWLLIDDTGADPDLQDHGYLYQVRLSTGDIEQLVTVIAPGGDAAADFAGLAGLYNGPPPSTATRRRGGQPSFIY